MSEQILPVAFRTETLYVVDYNDDPYTPMKPVVEGMGLDWKTQYRKLVACERYGHITMPLPSPGGIQDTLCLPLRKLNGWLFTINPQKVKPELKDRIIAYQEECFQVLYNYWNNKNKPAEEPSLPLMATVDPVLLREYRILDKRMAMRYLEKMGITSDHVGVDLHSSYSDDILRDIVPVNFILSHIEDYAKHQDDFAWYLMRDEWNKLCDGYNAKTTASWLRSNACLRTERGRLTTKGSPVMFNGSRPNVFCVLKSGLNTLGNKLEPGEQ